LICKSQAQALLYAVNTMLCQESVTTAAKHAVSVASWADSPSAAITAADLIMIVLQHQLLMLFACWAL